jgi:CubicO group peptidase (beta-lactamase class C family)
MGCLSTPGVTAMRGRKLQIKAIASGCLDFSWFTSLVLSVFVFLNLSPARGELSSHAIDDQVDKVVQDKMIQGHIPGLALAIIKSGKILKAQGYGYADIDRKILVATNTAFRIASVSKQFVATAIMMLVEENKLHLDDPVSKYLEGTPATWKQITTRHLLTHTSGIPDFLNENISVHSWFYGFDRGFLKAVAARPLHFAPGNEFRYSNSNYQLLGMIIRKITGEAYGDFLRERIFQPFGMTQTGISPIHGKFPGLAVGYLWKDNHLQPHDVLASSFMASAGGGIISTISDMAKWDAALYSEKLLKQSSLEQMWTPVSLNDGMKAHYGFGWGTSGRSDGESLVVSHGGNFCGFSSDIYRSVDDQLTVIILDNQHDYKTLTGLSQKIARLYVWKGPHSQPIPDYEPEITAHLQDVIDRSRSGKSRMEDFTAAEWAEWKPWQKQAQLDGAAYGPALSLVLVERSEENSKPSYRYRVQYSFGTVLLHVIIDEQNKIALWAIEDVDLK